MFYLKQSILFVFVILVATSCSNDGNPAGGDGGEVLEDGLTISFPEGYIEGVATIEAEGGHEDEHEDEGDGHFIPAGFQLELEGQDGYVYRELNLAPEGSITVSIADGPQEFTLHFLDSDGNEIDHEDHEGDEHCDDFLNQTDCESSEHCEWHAGDQACEDEEGHGDDHEEEHGMHIEITGLSSGTTYFQIQLVHDGHADFTSLGPPTTIDGTLYNGIPVIVTE